MRKILTITALWMCYQSVFGQVAVPDTIYIYETVIVYDTIVIRDTVRIKRAMDMPKLQAIDINANSFMDASKNSVRHAELVSASPANKEIAGQARNDKRIFLTPPPEKNISPPATFSENSIILHARALRSTSENNKNVKQKNIKPMKMNIASNLSAILLTAQTMSGISAQETKPEEDLKMFPIQLSFVYPMTTQGEQTVNYRYNLSYNLLTGRVGAVQGVEFGGLLNHAEQSVHGVQYAGLVNKTNELTGVQFAGIANFTGSVLGAQFAGITNICKEANGTRFAGIANMSEYTKGAQFAGIVNLTERSEGAQFAGISNISQEVSGASISGIYNRTGTLRGCQIGLVNVIDTIESGVSIALVNIVKKGFYKEWSLTFADYQNIGMSFKMGTKKFYTIFSAGANFMEDELWSFGVGVGNRTVLNHRFDFQPEIVFYHYLPIDFKNVQNLSSNHLKLGFVYKTNRRLGIVVAPSLYFLDAEIGGFMREISPIPPFYEYETDFSKFEINSKHRHSFGAGISIGIIM